LQNPDHALHPGMFAKVEVALPETKKTTVIPGSAVSYAPYGDSVFVIEKQKDEKSGKESLVLRQQFVRIGDARGDFVSVTQGLKAGQEVVSTGVFKLRNGMPVTVNNDLAPKPELNPKPADT
jgi:membrane fusion protein, multidrug efflux system